MNKSESIAKIAPALLKAQKNIGGAKKGAVNPFFHSAYATLGDVMEACKEPLLEEGISVLQLVGHDESGNYVETILLHESGEFISEKMTITCSKANDPQSQGSAISYAKRYGLQSACFIPSEDDDGEKAINRVEPRTPFAKTDGQSAPTEEKRLESGSEAWQSAVWHLPFGTSKDKSYAYKGKTLKEIFDNDPTGIEYWITKYEPSENPKTGKVNPKDVDLRQALTQLGEHMAKDNDEAYQASPVDKVMTEAEMRAEVASRLAIEQIDESWLIKALIKKKSLPVEALTLRDVSESVLEKVLGNWDILVRKYREEQ